MIDEPDSNDRNAPHYKSRSYAWIFAVVLTPILSISGSAITGYYTAKSATYKSDVEMAKLAVEIIQSKQSSIQMKDWALRLLAKHTQVKISPEERKAMVQIIDKVGAISINEIEQHNLLGGPNSLLRKPFNDLGIALDKKHLIEKEDGSIVYDPPIGGGALIRPPTPKAE